VSAAEPWPVEIRLRRARRELEVSFDDGARFALSARLLRAMTPSAADRGHGGPDFEPLPGVAPGVALTDVAPVGRYAVRLAFDDGHDSGYFTWARLHRIGREQAALTAALDG
jgi:DUF971 family protein